jgi:hypothetical protein
LQINNYSVLVTLLCSNRLSSGQDNLSLVEGSIVVSIRITAIAPLLAAGAAAVAIAAAPSASAAPNAPPCTEMGGSTQCQSTGNVQIYAAPHAVPGTANSTYGPFVGYNHGRN